MACTFSLPSCFEHRIQVFIPSGKRSSGRLTPGFGFLVRIGLSPEGSGLFFEFLYSGGLVFSGEWWDGLHEVGDFYFLEGFHDFVVLFDVDFLVEVLGFFFDDGSHVGPDLIDGVPVLDDGFEALKNTEGVPGFVCEVLNCAEGVEGG